MKKKKKKKRIGETTTKSDCRLYASTRRRIEFRWRVATRNDKFINELNLNNRKNSYDMEIT